MLLVVSAVLIGLVVGLALPRRQRRFRRPRLRLLPVLVIGAAAQIASFPTSGNLAVGLAVTGLSLLVVFTVANLHVTGMGVLAIGLAANLLVIVGNGGMPVREKALVAAGVASRDDVASVDLDGARHLETPDDHLMVLADIIPFPAMNAVVSFGDLIVAVALADIVTHIARRQRKRDRTVIDLRGGVMVTPPSEAPVLSTTAESPPSRRRRPGPSTPPARTPARP